MARWPTLLKEANDVSDVPRTIANGTADNYIANVISTRQRINRAKQELNAAFDAHFEARSILANHVNDLGLDVTLVIDVPEDEPKFLDRRPAHE